MLRIHFGADDMARLRIAPHPDALWETALSMHVLRYRTSDPLLDGWKSAKTQLLRSRNVLKGQMQVPFALNPPWGYFPDFLTPAAGLHGLDAGLEAILVTPKRQLDDEISRICDDRPATASLADDIRRGKPAALAVLAAQLRSYHDLTLRPVWARVNAAAQADRDLRGRQMADGGAAAVLDDLAPTARFRAGVLELHHFRQDKDIHLRGRGLTLIPSYFKEPTTLMMLADPQLAPVIVYPVRRDVRVATEAQRTAVSALIGHTRAAVLAEAAAGVTVSQIAGLLGISQPSATKHLTVLRAAGLLTATRDCHATRHTLTALGLNLLNGGTA